MVSAWFPHGFRMDKASWRSSCPSGGQKRGFPWFGRRIRNQAYSRMIERPIKQARMESVEERSNAKSLGRPFAAPSKVAQGNIKILELEC